MFLKLIPKINLTKQNFFSYKDRVSTSHRDGFSLTKLTQMICLGKEILTGTAMLSKIYQPDKICQTEI